MSIFFVIIYYFVNYYKHLNIFKTRGFYANSLVFFSEVNMHERIYKIASQEISDEILKYETKNQNDKNANYKLYIHIISKELNHSDHDKYYVGITKRKVNVRWGKDGKNYTGTHIKNAINKYGWKNIEHIIITEKLLKDEAFYIESKLIAYLHSNEKAYGYNISKGGDGGNRKAVCPVKQYDLDGNYIQTFDTITNAALAINCNRGDISQACKNHTKSHGYQWRYLKDNDIGYYQRKGQKDILQISSDGTKIINLYPSMAYILHKFSTYNKSSLHHVLNNKENIHTIYGYYWIYKENLINGFYSETIKLTRKEVEEYELYRKTS